MQGQQDRIDHLAGVHERNEGKARKGNHADGGHREADENSVKKVEMVGIEME